MTVYFVLCDCVWCVCLCTFITCGSTCCPCIVVRCSPTSTLSRSSSIDSCSELVEALDAMAMDLQQQSEAANREAALAQPPCTVATEEEEDISNRFSDEITHNDSCIPEEGHEEEKRLTKNLDLAEKEKYLTECKNQIKVGVPVTVIWKMFSGYIFQMNDHL